MVSASDRIAACCDLASDVAGSAGEVKLKLMGTSMLPSIWPGDVVTVRRCQVADLRPGEIVLYRGAGALTAHRLISVTPDNLILRGDSLEHCDPPVRNDQVVGRVFSICRNGRLVSVEQNFWQRMVSCAVRRSGLCSRVMLRFDLSESFG